MKLLLILLLVVTSLLSSDKTKITLGLGPYIQTQPYTNVDAIVVPSPVIFFDNELFYVRWTRFGVYFLGDKNDDFSWGLSLTAQPRTYGYDASDIAGMDKRETSFEGGIAFSLQKQDTWFEMMALTDVLDRHDSWILKAEVGHDFELGDFSLYPSVFAIYQTSDFMNYYYGVTQAEATRRTESIYIPGSAIQYGAQVYVKYPFTEKLSALLNIRADKLPSEATSSTIVNDTYIYSGLASLIYTFSY